MRTRSCVRTSGSAVAVIAAAALVVYACSSPTTPGTPIGLTCPATIAAQSPDGQPTNVALAGITTTGGTPPVTVSCSPPDGSRFPIGSTQVTCTATDGNRQNAACTLTVTVSPPPILAATRFVAYGDSITSGEDGRSFGVLPLSVSGPNVLLPFLQTYPGVLQQLLAARYTRQSPTVTPRGNPGQMLSDSSTLGIFFIFTSAAQFDVVLLMEGSNDVNAMDKDLGVEGPALANLQQMVRDAKSRGQRVMLATIPPMNSSATATARNQGARLVPEFNDRIRGIAAAENVPLVDVYTALNVDVNRFVGTVDGLHLTPDGYARVASTFLTAIQQNLEQPTLPTAEKLRIRN